MTTEVIAALPPHLRSGGRNDWARVRRNGRSCDSFLEGACLDPSGVFWCVDIANGRLLNWEPKAGWSVAHEYDGWPTGMKLVEGGALVADNRLGLVQVSDGAHRVLVAGVANAPFHGLNDLTIAADGAVYFTDQGDSDLAHPYGRVFRWRPGASAAPELLCEGVPSPNGIALSLEGDILYIAVTQANSIWRLMLKADGSPGKLGHGIQLSGSRGGGPDGIAFDGHGNLHVCHALAACIRVYDRLCEPLAVIRMAEGTIPTNLVVDSEGGRVLVTEAQSATIQSYDIPGGRA
jgi:gluconolactonase